MYNPEIPLIESSPSTSYLPIQTNFAQFAAIFAQALGSSYYNHVALNDPNQGKHGAMLLQNQNVDPGVNTNQASLYSNTYTTAAGTQNQLFAQIQKFLPNKFDTTEAANLGMPLTYNTVGITAPFYTFLPGGYLLYFGSSVVSVPIVLAPVPAQILCAQAVATATGTAPKISPLPNTNVPYDAYVTVTQPSTILISSNRAPAGSTFLYFAIAKA